VFFKSGTNTHTHTHTTDQKFGIIKKIKSFERSLSPRWSKRLLLW